MIKMLAAMVALVATMVSPFDHAESQDLYSPINGVEINVSTDCHDPETIGYSTCVIATYSNIQVAYVDVMLDICRYHTTCDRDTVVVYNYSASDKGDVKLTLASPLNNRLKWDAGIPDNYILKSNQKVAVIFTTHDAGASWRGMLKTSGSQT